MRISAEQLISLPVYTKSSLHLGEVYDLEIDVESQAIINYIVQSKRTIKHLFEKKLIVHHSQVISITEAKVIVDDLVGEKMAVLLQEGKQEVKAAPENAEGVPSPTANSTANK